MSSDQGQDAIYASIDVIRRMGATMIEIGYLNEDAPTSEQADWYAQAIFRGTKIFSEHHTSPTQAVDSLARRLLDGAICQQCGRVVSLDRSGYIATDTIYIDGTTMTSSEQARIGMCLWTREGLTWTRQCETTKHSRR